MFKSTEHVAAAAKETVERAVSNTFIDATQSHSVDHTLRNNVAQLWSSTGLQLDLFLHTFGITHWQRLASLRAAHAGAGPIACSASSVSARRSPWSSGSSFAATVSRTPAKAERRSPLITTKSSRNAYRRKPAGAPWA